MVEAMAMALPVIVTNWSGPTAYLDESVGYPLRVQELVDIKQEGAFQGRLLLSWRVEHCTVLHGLHVALLCCTLLRSPAHACAAHYCT